MIILSQFFSASQNNYDSDDYDTVDSQKNSKQSNALSSNQRGSLGPEPRPRAKTPTDLGGSKKESSVNQQTSIKHPPEEDEESDWDEDELRLVPSVKIALHNFFICFHICKGRVGKFLNVSNSLFM